MECFGAFCKREVQVALASSGFDDKSQVLASIDIVELIGQTVGLKRSGSKYLGLCPFHQEKSPSFNVNPARQFFHCFGCKASGNAIDFVMKRDRIEFMDALRMLAERAGITLRGAAVSKEKIGQRQSLIDAHVAAVEFFQANLRDESIGNAARDYLKQRGFTDETIAQWKVGLAIESWDALLKSGSVRKFPPALLHTAGLIKSRDGSSFYDTFRNRLMFPIRDEMGRTIAFGGRVVPGSDDPAKYLNSPETPLFSKSRCVFGFDMAKQRINDTRTVAVVEGYTDVMMAHQFGVSNVVSILGVGLTAQHMDILRRLADRVVLLFDPDSAGDQAADRVVQLFLSQNIEMAVAALPEGMDPDEYLLAHGAAEFEKVLATAEDVLTFKWRQLSSRFMETRGDLTGQQKAVTEYLELLAKAKGGGPVDPVRWGGALARVSRLTEIPVDELNRRFRSRRPTRRTSGNPPVQAVDTEQPTMKDSADSATQPAVPIASNQRVAERWILGILLSEPHRWPDVQVHVHVSDFADPQHRRIAEVYWNCQRDEGELVFSTLLSLLDEPLKELAIGLVDEIEGLKSGPRQADKEAHAMDQANELAGGMWPPVSLDESLKQAMEFLAECKQDREQEKRLIALQSAGESNENNLQQDARSLFEDLVKNSRSTNLRRLPIKWAR
jgi:DNA primase